jgi:hypothetical protein
MGKWDESMYCTIANDAPRVNCSASGQNTDATLLWEKNGPSADPTRYNLSSFAITLNELTPELKVDRPAGMLGSLLSFILCAASEARNCQLIA